MNAKPTYEELEQRIKELESEIAQHLRTEETLFRGKNFIDTLLHSAPSLFCAVSLDGKIIIMSESLLRVLGKTQEEVRGSDCLPALFPEDEWDIYKKFFKQIMDTRKPVVQENHVLAKDGSSILVEWHGIPVLKADGGIDFFFGLGMDITERKKTEEALRESEQRLAGFIDFLPDPTMAVDLDERITVWNRAMEELTNIPAADMLGKGRYVYALPFYGKQRPLLMNLLLNTGLEPEGLYSEINRNDNVLMGEAHASVNGKQLWMMLKAGKLFDDRGNVIGAIQSFRDITAGKDAQERLKISEETYRTVFESTGTGMTIVEADTIISLANSRFEELTGYSKEEVEGKMSWTRIIPPGEVERLMNFHVMRRKGSPDVPTTYESRIIDVKGNTRDILFNACMIAGTDKSIVSLIDITTRKKTEDALKRSQELAKLLARNIHEVIAVLDMNLQMTYVTPSVERMLGITAKELLSLIPEQYLTPTSSRYVRDIVLAELELGSADSSVGKHQPLTFEAEMVRRDGTTIWTEVTASVMTNGQGANKSIVAVARDISERKKSEEERKRYEMRLARAQKMEAIGTLAGGIAHDFNNILSPILGFTELTVEDLPKGSTMHRNLTEVINAANRAKDLVKQILTFSRQVETATRPVQVHLIVKEVLKLLRSTIPSTIEIRQQIDTGSGRVLADPTHIHQVIMNLCTNAYHAMLKTGGTLRVNLKPIQLDSISKHLFPVSREGEFIKLSVIDTGCGMSSDTMQRIFDPFFTTKEKDGGGTGLGLATVHGIVQSLNGAVSVSSEPGKGSTFDVYLPRLYADICEESHQQPDLPRGNGECILMVDDEKTILEMGKSMLDNLGYTTVVIASSAQALEAFRLSPKRFDCVITDMTMPSLTGEQLAAEMLKLRPDLPVILSSGYFEDLAPRMKSLAVKEYLEKPYTLQRLAEAVSRAIRNG